MTNSNREIFNEFVSRTGEQVKSASIFLGGLALLYSAEVTSEVMDTAGDILVATPTAAVGILMAANGLKKMFNNGLRSDFKKKISER
jgi:hypothetical protein